MLAHFAEDEGADEGVGDQIRAALPEQFGQLNVSDKHSPQLKNGARTINGHWNIHML